MTPRELVQRWHDDAERLRRYGDERCASVLELCAVDLEHAVTSAETEALTLQEAAAARSNR